MTKYQQPDNVKNADEIQKEASNPSHSVWVSASAGTGKTKILIDRILRILLKEVNIENILCITYTKAAAQEMIQRLMDILAKWSIINDNELKEILEKLTGVSVTENQIKLAQSLFGKVIDAPYGINIQTIHSFCESILARFPIEAGISINSNIVENTKEIEQEAIEIFLNKILSDDEYKNLIKKNNISNFNLTEYIKKILSYSQELELMKFIYNISEHNYDDLEKSLFSTLNIKNTDITSLIKDYLQNSDSFFQELLPCLQELNTKVNTGKYDEIIRFLEKDTSYKIDNLQSLEKIFFTQKKTIRKSAFTVKEYSFININKDLIKEEQEKLYQLKLLIEQIQYANLNIAYLKIAFNIYDNYQSVKLKNNYLDFNDLIIKTYELLTKEGLSSWVLYKLDYEIEHILVDEAQDTNPIQWEIIKLFLNEFFSGESANNKHRTIFVVGDIKQSIYSFQKADPFLFSQSKKELERKITDAKQVFKQIPMQTSFRSAQGITHLVNQVSKVMFDINADPYQNEKLEHISYKKDLPWNIEIWPVITSEEESIDKEQYLAEAISHKIIDLNQNYNIDFKDIMILYEKRANNKSLDYLIKALKQNNIPVLGIDKLTLKDSIIIEDLISLMKFILQTKDEFSLAIVLKSPFFNLNDQDLLNLKTNYNSLLKGVEKEYSGIYQTLINWVNKADFMSPYSFFFEIIYKSGYIKSIVARLGQEALDPIDEFMIIVDKFQNEQGNSLQEFMHFLVRDDNAIKRENPSNVSSIKLSTVHGSKGLESKVVFILNDLDQRTKEHNIIFNYQMDKPLLFKNHKQSKSSPYINSLITKYENDNLEEKKRLLYVALTRAKEHLYFCSVKNKSDTENKPNNWYSIITNALEGDEFFVEKENPFFSKNLGFINNKVIQYSKNLKVINELEKNKVSDLSLTDYPWLNTVPEKEERLSKPLTPTQIDLIEEFFSSPLEKNNFNKNNNLNKGIILHNILEQINTLDQNKKEYIDMMLNSQNNLSSSDVEELKLMINKILNNKDFQFLFQHQSLNEITVTGTLDINGVEEIFVARIDKLIILENEVIILDYKFAYFNNKHYIKYVNQLNIYKKLLHNIYPDKKIKAYILYTKSSDLVEV